MLHIDFEMTNTTHLSTNQLSCQAVIVRQFWTKFPNLDNIMTKMDVVLSILGRHTQLVRGLALILFEKPIRLTHVTYLTFFRWFLRFCMCFCGGFGSLGSFWLIRCRFRRSSILSDVRTRGNTKLPSCKSVLVLGDNESGKTTLVAKLQGVEDPKKGSGLEYAYIDVRDEYRDGK